MKHRTLTLRAVAGLAAFALIGSACSSAATSTASGDMETSESSPRSEGSAPAVDTAAATLTRDLTGLLASHEYLAGISVYTAVAAKGDLEDPTVQAAVGALDDNSKDLAGAIAGTYGDEAGEKFLKLWRAHIGFFVDYTLGKATGDAAMTKTAEKDLDGYRQDFGALIEGATEGELTQAQVAEALAPHVDMTTDAIDSVVAGKADAFDKLQEAANHLPMVATALSTAISAQQGLDGEADDAAAVLQRDLTSLLKGHEYLAGISLYTAVQAQGDLKDPTVQAAIGALDDNSKALAAAVASVYGDAAGVKFLKLWRAHIGFFVNYTLGKATGDAAMARAAEKDLDGYRQDFGALIEGATEGGLTQSQVAEVLTPHVEATKDAIDSVVAGRADAFDKLQEAAGHMPHIATALAGAIVAQFPDKF